MGTVYLSQLQENPVIGHLPEDQLNWLLDKSEIRCLQPGDKAFSPGDPTDHMFIILEGKMRLWMDQNGTSREIGRMEKGDVSGLLPYSRLKSSRATGVILESMTLLAFHRDHMPELIRDHYELTAALVHHMTNRVRDFEARQRQNEKLLSLGKLSAGLAHELNNPAAAVVRSAEELKASLRYLPENFKRVISLRLEGEQVDTVNDMLFHKVNNGIIEIPLIERNEREDDLTDWMEDHGIEDPDALLENFLDYGMTEEDLELVLAQVQEPQLPGVLGWLNQVMNTERLVGEIHDASERISSLVHSIKGYSRMDEGEGLQQVDIHQGMINTAVILKHKFKQNKVSVEKNLEADLPKVQGYPGELNQVWTNLMDNALDAMKEGGTLAVSTKREGPCVVIEIVDSGSGIPEDVLPNIFDPFYTTKPMGEGTGLGLDTVQKIITHHHGSIEVESNPGRTAFKIWLPIEQ